MTTQEAIQEYAKGALTFGEVLDIYKANKCFHLETLPTNSERELCVSCGQLVTK